MGTLTDLKEYDYHLPKGLIAQVPAVPRDSCRLMILSRETGKVEHRVFSDIVEVINPGDVLVLNNTKVIKARLRGRKRDTWGKVEVLLLRPFQENQGENTFSEVWETIVRPASRIREGSEILFYREVREDDFSPGEPLLRGKVLSKKQGKVIFGFNFHGTFSQTIDEIGEVPLPPYIKRGDFEKRQCPDSEWYQTVFAEKVGAVAAPTAGLHFTEGLLERIREKGAKIVFVTLHVGWGSFRPIRQDNITLHRLEPEYFEVSQETASEVNRALESSRRIIAVGTTAVRTLESCLAEQSVYDSVDRRRLAIKSQAGWTNLFIYPGYKFRVIDGLLTNFHLPKSTHLILVSAFAGKERVFHAYQEAIKRKYRFYSYGDAMLIL